MPHACPHRHVSNPPQIAKPLKVSYYHKAHAAMGKGLKRAATVKEATHVAENQAALKQSMNAEQVQNSRPSSSAPKRAPLSASPPVCS